MANELDNAYYFHEEDVKVGRARFDKLDDGIDPRYNSQ
jgi:hypothetical protein